MFDPEGPFFTSQRQRHCSVLNMKIINHVVACTNLNSLLDIDSHSHYSDNEESKEKLNL